MELEIKIGMRVRGWERYGGVLFKADINWEKCIASVIEECIMIMEHKGNDTDGTDVFGEKS